MEICIEMALLFQRVREIGTQKQVKALPFEGNRRRLCQFYKISKACLQNQLKEADEIPFEMQMDILRRIGYTSRYIIELRSQYHGDSAEEGMER